MMADALVYALQLIGSLTAVGLACSAVIAYLIIWPVDKYLVRIPMSLDEAVTR